MTEPVAFFDPQEKGFYWAKPTKVTAPTIVDVEPLALYTQRTWVGLTPEDTFEIGERLGLSDIAWVDLMQAIEAKLKQKNS
jgi:hypothetical protein